MPYTSIAASRRESKGTVGKEKERQRVSKAKVAGLPETVRERNGEEEEGVAVASTGERARQVDGLQGTFMES